MVTTTVSGAAHDSMAGLLPLLEADVLCIQDQGAIEVVALANEQLLLVDQVPGAVSVGVNTTGSGP